MTTPEYPGYSKPCNGCGRCCEQNVCPLGIRVLGRRAGPCPALRKIEEPTMHPEPRFFRYSCGLVVDPISYAPALTMRHGKEAMAEAAIYLNGMGVGCDFSPPDAEVPPEARDFFERIYRRGRDPRKAARMSRRWGFELDE